MEGAPAESQGIMSPHPRQAACWPCDRGSHFPSLGTGFCMSSCPPSSAVTNVGPQRRQAGRAISATLLIVTKRTQRPFQSKKNPPVSNLCPPAEPQLWAKPLSDRQFICDKESVVPFTRALRLREEKTFTQGLSHGKCWKKNSVSNPRAPG